MKQEASRHNATIGIAREGNLAMLLPSVTRRLASLSPEDYAWGLHNKFTSLWSAITNRPWNG